MTWRLWLLVGGVAALAIAVMFALLARTRGQRDTARADLVACQVTVNAEAISIREARAAAERLGTEVKDNASRCEAALADLRAGADRARAALRKCQSAETVAERLGALFP